MAVTEYWVVLSSSYFGANIRTTPNERDTKWLPWQRPLPSNGARDSEIYDRIFKNENVYKLQMKTYIHHDLQIT